MKKTNKVLSLMLTFIVAMMMFVGCSSKPTTMKDREGNEFNVPKQVNTIISTAPSNTEVLVALGLADKLVAVDKYSVDVEGVSSDITKIDFRNPDAEKIISLKPDIVIASGHNKVGDEDPFALIKEAGIPVAYIPSSYSIDEIYGDIEFIASLTNTEKKGKELVDSMKKEVEKVENIIKQTSLYLQVNHYNSEEFCKESVDQMVEALSDDLNTSLALTQILGQVKVLNQAMRNKDKDNAMISKGYQTLLRMLDVVGFVHEVKVLSDEDIELYQHWQSEKAAKNFEVADQLREKLQAKGII